MHEVAVLARPDYKRNAIFLDTAWSPQQTLNPRGLHLNTDDNLKFRDDGEPIDRVLTEQSDLLAKLLQLVLELIGTALFLLEWHGPLYHCVR
jgi:hypothetical protein